MKRSSLFGHIVELHHTITTGSSPADAVVREFFRSRHYLGSKDRRYISDLLFGLFRHYKLVEVYGHEVLGRLNASSRAIHPVILIAVYCAKLLQEQVDTLRSDLCGLWRVYAGEVDCETFLHLLSSVDLPDDVAQHSASGIATRYSFPETIVEEWLSRFGADETGKLCNTLNQPAPVTIRVNTYVTSVDDCVIELAREGLDARRTVLSPVGLVLPKRINAQALRSFKEGYFEMQDEGSQLLSMLLEARPGMLVVDACVGGGGKTLHLASIMKNEGTLISIDVDERRLRNIHERIRRAKVTIARPLLAGKDADVIRSYTGAADAVLVDAPCSGVGTFRRNPAAKVAFTDSFVAAVAEKQRDVLNTYAALVKPGGRLVYSTCTLLQKENEDQVSSFLATHPDFTLLSTADILKRQGVAVESASSFLTLLPHVTGTDGFFAAVMLRRSH